MPLFNSPFPTPPPSTAVPDDTAAPVNDTAATPADDTAAATSPPAENAPVSVLPASNAPVISPAPGWIFFFETLPFTESLATPEKVAAAVLLSLESHSPFPVEQLAHGHIADVAAKKLLYYATARERLRLRVGRQLWEHATFLLPDFLLAPRKTPNQWHWLATPLAITAVRFDTPADTFPAEIRSWPLPEANADTPLIALANAARKERQPLCDGDHAPDILLWSDNTSRTRNGKLTALWESSHGSTVPIVFPESTAWHADVRESAWLTRERKKRTALHRANALLIASVALWLLAGIMASLSYFQKKQLHAATTADKAGQAQLDELKFKASRAERLDEIERSRFSFYDALATLNYFRPPDILFTRAEANDHRQIQITGVASTTGQINTYVATLRKNNFFSEVADPKTTTASERTSFDLTLTVGDLKVSRSSPLPSSAEINTMINSFIGAPATTTAPAATTNPPPTTP